MPAGMETGRSKQSPVPRRRRQQVIRSIPHYVNELRRLRSLRELRNWTYYKFPARFKLRTFPTAITLEITNECNFGCPHCPRSFLNADRDLGFMTLAVATKLADEIAGRVSEVKIIGLGEGALHPELPAIVRTFADRAIRVRLYTNGTLFERYGPEEIFSWGLDGIVLSIDGTDSRSFERLRPGGDYLRTRASLQAFSGARRQRQRQTAAPRIQVRHVIMPRETEEQLAEFKRDWLGLGGDTVKFNSLAPPYDRKRIEDKGRPPCRDIRREVHIRWDGRVPLCGYGGDREWIGDLRDSSLQEIWRATRLQEVRAAHQAGDLSGLEMCRTCQHR